MKRYLLLLPALILLLLACGQREEAKEAEPAPPAMASGGMESQPAPEMAQPMPETAQPAPAEATGETAGLKLPEAVGRALYIYITETAPYKEWDLFPGTEEFYPGSEPHGALLTTYVNQLALSAIQGKEGVIPAGGILVKENYSADKELLATTVMYRIPGYDPAAGDWFWLKYTPDGNIAAEGQVEGCIDCHRQAAANDWLFTLPISR